MLVTRAPAKINLTLHVIGRRVDGYHELESLVAFTGAGDTLALEPGPTLSLEVTGPTAPAAGAGDDNLVLRAARNLAERAPGLHLGAFRLEKRLPVAAGIGGGSSDAAAALRLLARANGLAADDPRLLDAARATGSDVPVCLDARARMMLGAGENLGPKIRLPLLPAVLINPGVPVETAPVFKAMGLQPGQSRGGGAHPAVADGVDAGTLLSLLARCRNDLEDAACLQARVIVDVLAVLRVARGCKLARMSGSGFFALSGDGALLERALINFMLDLHLAQGYRELVVPYLVNRAAMTGTGQLPKLADDMYRAEVDDLFLIPTAEVPVTNFHREETLRAEQLPLRYVAFSPCFRREAGSAGKDTRGLLRLHQFHKVEMVQFTGPEDSWRALEELTDHAEEVLRRLELPYRVVMLAAGDLSFAAAKCYDLEVWAAGVGKWLEVSSCSNFTDFQARRAGIRCKGAGGTAFVHTLNGSGLALPRLMVALLENGQTPEGRVRVPAALRPYVGGRELLG